MTTPDSLLSDIDKAIAMTDERLTAAPRDMLKSIRTQLSFMRDTIAAGRAPTVDEKNRLTIGVIAAREFEDSDPAYADALADASFAFKKR